MVPVSELSCYKSCGKFAEFAKSNGQHLPIKCLLQMLFHPFSTSTGDLHSLLLTPFLHFHLQSFISCSSCCHFFSFSNNFSSLHYLNQFLYIYELIHHSNLYNQKLTTLKKNQNDYL